MRVVICSELECDTRARYYRRHITAERNVPSCIAAHYKQHTFVHSRSISVIFCAAVTYWCRSKLIRIASYRFCYRSINNIGRTQTCIAAWIYTRMYKYLFKSSRPFLARACCNIPYIYIVSLSLSLCILLNYEQRQLIRNGDRNPLINETLELRNCDTIKLMRQR